MKIWISKDKKKCLRLDTIKYWEYQSKEDAIAFNTKVEIEKTDKSAFVFLMDEKNLLKIYISKTPILFNGDEAEEIYKLLIDNINKNIKEII